jgi:hypothetical protein
MDYISIKNCPCTTKFTCLIHRPDYNYSFLGIDLDDILKKENINYETYLTILENKKKEKQM